MRKPVSAFAVHAILGLYTLLALFPIVLVVMNSFKAKRAIFNTPLRPPSPVNFDPIGYLKVFGDSSVGIYYMNSVTVTLGSIFFTLLFGAMAAWALTEYKFRWNTLLALYLSIGIMVPIRLGSVSIIQLVADLNLINTRTALILVYTALLAIPDELIDAATVDGLNQFQAFIWVKLPLILPTLGLVSVLTFVNNFNAFDLIYAMKGALAGPNFSADIMGTLFYRVFFGNQLQLGDTSMGSAIATMMFLIILTGVMIYLFLIQRRMQRYSF